MTNKELKEKVASLIGLISSSGDMDGGEMQDVVNNDDVVVGSLPRGVIWDNGLENYTRAVSIFVENEKKEIMLPIRSMKKKNWPGGYDFSCGEQLMSGESYEEASVRGLREELGLENVALEEKAYYHPDEKNGIYGFGKVYICKVNADLVRFVLNPNEVDGFEWKSLGEIKELLNKDADRFKRGYKSVFGVVFGE